MLGGILPTHNAVHDGTEETLVVKVVPPGAGVEHGQLPPSLRRVSTYTLPHTLPDTLPHSSSLPVVPPPPLSPSKKKVGGVGGVAADDVRMLGKSLTFAAGESRKSHPPSGFTRSRSVSIHSNRGLGAMVRRCRSCS